MSEFSLSEFSKLIIDQFTIHIIGCPFGRPFLFGRVPFIIAKQ